MADAPATSQLSPFPFIDALLAYQKTAALKAALDLKVFDAIGAGANSVADIAAATGASPRGIRILCDYLTVLGFLDKNGEDYRQAPVTAAFVDARSPRSMGGVAQFLAGPALLRLFLDDPAGYVRRGGTEGLANMTPEDPIWVTFAQTMVPFTAAAAAATASYAAGAGPAPRKILDIAAGGGIFGLEAAKTFPEAHIVAVDWPNVLRVARQNAEAASLGARYETIAGDAFTVDWGDRYDLVLLPNILHHFDQATCVTLLKKVRASLSPGGRTLVVDFVPNEDRISPPVPASFAFMMLGTTQHGDAFTLSDYAAMGRQAGYARAAVAPLPPSPESVVELFD